MENIFPVSCLFACVVRGLHERKLIYEGLTDKSFGPFPQRQNYVGRIDLTKACKTQPVSYQLVTQCLYYLTNKKVVQLPGPV